MNMGVSIWADIMRFFHEYAPNGCLLAVVVMGVVFLYETGRARCFGVEKQDKEAKRNQMWRISCHMVWIFLFVLYVYVLVGITILSRSESGTREASFQLFRTFHNTFYARKQIYENIIMFVPYAVLLYGLLPSFRKWYFYLLTGAASSLLIEVTQWVTKTGYFELDDMMLNTFGMMIGYAICAIAEFGWKMRKRKTTIR